MTRFIVLTFAFLAWSFYELSGGAEYEPRVLSEPVFASVEPLETETVEPRISTSSRITQTPAPQSASLVVQAALTVEETSELKPEPAAIITPQTRKTREFVTIKPLANRVAVTLTPKQPDAAEMSKDLRAVSGNRVNMRNGPGTTFSVVTSLPKGTSVEVLDDGGDGWLKLRVVDTGDIGYMADWLVTAAAN